MRRAGIRALSLVLALTLLPALRAQSPGAEADPRLTELHLKLAQQLRRMSTEFDGILGIAVKDLKSGEAFGVNAETVFPQASSIKIPILVELFRQEQEGTLRLEERVEVKRAQMVGGSGVLQRFGDGTSALSLHDLAVLMIVLSDNSATNILIDRVGIENVNGTLRRLGLAQTRLQRRMMETEAQRASRENLSTPHEMAMLLELLHQGKLLDAAHTTAALEILRYPKNTPLRGGLPENVALADKPGSLPGVRCDSGIVLLEGRPYVISVMTTYNGDDEIAERAISDLSRRVFEHFGRIAHSNVYGVRLP
jgi:beta-lactamase class A